MDITINLSIEEVNYLELQEYLISNCKKMYSPVEISDGEGAFLESEKTGQYTRYEFEGLEDVDLYEHRNGLISIRLMSLEYESGIRILNELERVLGLTKYRKRPFS